MKQPAFGAQTSQFSFGKAATTSSGFNTPQQTGAFNLGGQTGAAGNSDDKIKMPRVTPNNLLFIILTYP